MEEYIRRVEICGSTNTELARLAEAGASVHTTVVARQQTAGRGRAGHVWEAPAGSSLLFSTLVSPNVSFEVLPLVTMCAGLGVCEAVREETHLEAGIKWPNDILIGGRKCAGILCEGVPMRAEGKGIAVIIGVGINVSTSQEALPQRFIFPATSLALEGAKWVDTESLLRRVLQSIWGWVDCLEREGTEKILSCFQKNDALCERRLRVVLPNGNTLVGISVGIRSSGALRLLTDYGEEEILAGSVLIE